MRRKKDGHNRPLQVREPSLEQQQKLPIKVKAYSSGTRNPLCCYRPLLWVRLLAGIVN